MQKFDALIVSHGQPSAPEPAELALAEFAGRVRAALPDVALAAATMAAPGRLEAALDRLKPGGLVYPLFMADGWFVRTALMGRIGGTPITLMTPFGMDPALPGLVADKISNLDAAHGTAEPVLIAAHGSGSGRAAPARSTFDFADRLSAALGDRPVSVGFLEQDPSLATALAQAGDPAALCLPFLAMDGNHMRHDVRRDLAAAGFTGKLLPVISQMPGAGAMVARAIIRQFAGEIAPLKLAI